MSTMLRKGNETAGAVFSRCEKYRYLLWRHWGPKDTRILWLMLNPSTADEQKLDPTVTRCQGYTSAWGFGGFEVCNLFALRATDPQVMRADSDPVGTWNDAAILEASQRADLVVCAWGNHGTHRGRAGDVCRRLEGAGIALHALAITGQGEPRHPLYCKRSLTPTQYFRGNE
jgi:hypothetical protein